MKGIGEILMSSLYFLGYSSRGQKVLNLAAIQLANFDVALMNQSF